MTSILPVTILHRVRGAADDAGRQARAIHWVGLTVFAGIYIALFLHYYPPTHGIEDEVGFINQALALSRGALTPEGAGFDTLQDFRPYNGRLVGIRNPGRPLLSAPFVALGGLRAVFLSGALVHLGLTLASALIFVRMGLSPLWGSMVLWHPTLCLYSRTVMGDTAAGLAVLGVPLALLAARRRGALAGLAIGASALMRYQSMLVLPFVGAAMLADREDPHRRRSAMTCLLAGGAAGALIVAYNLYLYGSPTGIVKGEFGLRYLPGNVLFYAVVLSAIWPMMLIAPLLDRSRLRHAIAALCAPTLAFFCLWYFHDRGPGWIQTLVVGPRLLQVVLPVWIVSWCLVVERSIIRSLAPRFPRATAGGLVAVTLATLAAFNGVMFARHQRHLDNLLDLRSELVRIVSPGSLLLANAVAWKLVGVPYPDLPAYRLMQVGDPGAREAHAREEHDWFVAILGRDGEASLDDEPVRDIAAQAACQPVVSRRAELSIWRCPPGPAGLPHR